MALAPSLPALDPGIDPAEQLRVVGANLYRLRVLRVPKPSAPAVAAAAGVGKNTLQKLEAARDPAKAQKTNQPKLDTLVKLANYYGVAVSDLLTTTPPYLSSSSLGPPGLRLVHSTNDPAASRVVSSVDLASDLRRPGQVASEGKRASSSLRSVRDGSSPRTRGRGGG